MAEMVRRAVGILVHPRRRVGEHVFASRAWPRRHVPRLARNCEGLASETWPEPEATRLHDRVESVKVEPTTDRRNSLVAEVSGSGADASGRARAEPLVQSRQREKDSNCIYLLMNWSKLQNGCKEILCVQVVTRCTHTLFFVGSHTNESLRDLTAATTPPHLRLVGSQQPSIIQRGGGTRAVIRNHFQRAVRLQDC